MATQTERDYTIRMAQNYNHDLMLIDVNCDEALELHEQRISEYADSIDSNELRELFMDHCIMPEA